MAMSSTALSASIRSTLITAGLAIDDVGTDYEEVWNLLCQEIVNHIQNNAVVTVASGIPVTTTGGSGYTSATGTGTIA